MNAAGAGGVGGAGDGCLALPWNSQNVGFLKWGSRVRPCALELDEEITLGKVPSFTLSCKVIVCNNER